MFYTMLYWDLKNSLQNTLYYLYGICYSIMRFEQIFHSYIELQCNNKLSR